MKENQEIIAPTLQNQNTFLAHFHLRRFGRIRRRNRDGLVSIGSGQKKRQLYSLIPRILKAQLNCLEIRWNKGFLHPKNEGFSGRWSNECGPPPPKKNYSVTTSFKWIIKMSAKSFPPQQHPRSSSHIDHHPKFERETSATQYGTANTKVFPFKLFKKKKKN